MGDPPLSLPRSARIRAARGSASKRNIATFREHDEQFERIERLHELRYVNHEIICFLVVVGGENSFFGS
jgi:hypothetical protein